MNLGWEQDRDSNIQRGTNSEEKIAPGRITSGLERRGYVEIGEQRFVAVEHVTSHDIRWKSHPKPAP